MPSRKRKDTVGRNVRQQTLPFLVSKRTADPAFTTSPSKRSKYYVPDTDESSSEQESEDDCVYVERGSDSIEDGVDDSSDSGSVIAVSVKPLAVSPKEKEKEHADKQSRVDPLFKSMPIEIHQRIAEYLPNDTDITRYSRVCKKSSQAITVSVWRLRFIQTFDSVPDATTEELARKYASRRQTTNNFTMFGPQSGVSTMSVDDFRKTKEGQEKCLDMLTNLIMESDASMVENGNNTGIIVGKNLEYIRNYVSDVPGTTGNVVNIIDSILKTDNDWRRSSICSVDSSPETRVLLIQLCLTSISWDPRYCNNSISLFDLSQLEAYAHPQQQPLFLGKWKNDLNVRWCLHVVNFFKFHLKAKKGEGILAHAYADLPQHQLPRWFCGRLQQGTQQLGTHWKGAYFYLDRDELTRMRTRGGDGQPFSDELNGGESFQDISIFFDDEKFGKQHWPASWEKILQSDPFSSALANANHRHTSRRSTRSRKAKKHKEVPNPGAKYFYGCSKDSREAHFYGVVHAIPAQKEIHGFQRVSMMKFFPDENGGYDSGQVWGYEGCVLPGGSIIVGRWWDARAETDGDVFSGPFIFWNVDKSDAEVPMDGQDALDFLNLMKYEAF